MCLVHDVTLTARAVVGLSSGSTPQNPRRNTEHFRNHEQSGVALREISAKGIETIAARTGTGTGFTMTVTETIWATNISISFVSSLETTTFTETVWATATITTPTYITITTTDTSTMTDGITTTVIPSGYAFIQTTILTETDVVTSWTETVSIKTLDIYVTEVSVTTLYSIVQPGSTATIISTLANAVKANVGAVGDPGDASMARTPTE
jgi:hypothetical protein